MLLSPTEWLYVSLLSLAIAALAVAVLFGGNGKGR